jgi:hypothetical protein
MNSFAESTFVLGMPNASFFATGLFFEGFRTAFPLPPADAADRWRQYVAFYRWSDASVEPIAFANFIRHGDAYLLGGLCARRNFYRRLPRAHWRECKARGGIAQMLLETAAQELDDATSIFGYCGDKKSWLVGERVGFARTAHRYLIVKWLRDAPDAAKREIEESVARVGPF